MYLEVIHLGGLVVEVVDYQQVVNDLELDLLFGRIGDGVVVLIDELGVKLKDVNLALVRIGV